MNDNDIIKALECCSQGSFVCGENCPRYENGTLTIPACRFELLGNALDLINRQKAEIERLQKAGEEAVSCFTRMESLYKIKCKELEVIKIEAIKEFAERLKTKHHTWKTSDWILIKGVPLDYIDNLVKEMTEGKE